MEITNQFFLPEEFKERFYAEDFLEIGGGYKLIVHEKEENIPEELLGKEAVLNGFLNPLTLIDHPVKAQLMHIEIHRRRWKESGETESYSNTYDLNPKGCKLTRGFGIFLKELTGRERSELFSTVKGLEDLWEKNKSLV